MKTTRNAYKDEFNEHKILRDRNSDDIRCNAKFCSCGKRQWFTNHDNFADKHGLEY